MGSPQEGRQLGLIPSISIHVSGVVGHVTNGLTSAGLLTTLAHGLRFALVPKGLRAVENQSVTNSKNLAASTQKEQPHAF